MPPDQPGATFSCDTEELTRCHNNIERENEPTISPYCKPSGCSLPQRSLQHRVPHVQQLFNWDCGLACAMMILKAVGHHHCDYTQLRQLCPTTSIWTIDLAHLLRRFNLGVAFTTITLGSNPAYANESFYSASIEEDEARVARLFGSAPGVGISVMQRSVEAEVLAGALLRGDTLVVVLVDKRRLDPWLAAADTCLPYTMCGFAGSDVVGYTGHYILLVGYDGERSEFLIRDPAGRNPGEPARLSPGALDAARKAFGTDEDVLFLSHPTLARRAHAAQLRQQQVQEQQQQQGQQLWEQHQCEQDLQQRQRHEQEQMERQQPRQGHGQGQQSRREGDQGRASEPPFLVAAVTQAGRQQCMNADDSHPVEANLKRASSMYATPQSGSPCRLSMDATAEAPEDACTSSEEATVVSEAAPDTAATSTSSIWTPPWVAWGVGSKCGTNAPAFPWMPAPTKQSDASKGSDTNSASIISGWSWGPLFAGPGFVWNSSTTATTTTTTATTATSSVPNGANVSADTPPAKPHVTCQ